MLRWTARIVTLVAIAMPACSASHAYVQPLKTAEIPAVATIGSLSDLHASIRAPHQLDYDAQSLGPTGRFVSIRLENTSADTVPVANLHATFACSREGVPFRCNSHVSGAAGAVEPSHLGRGQSFTFERLFDCVMPLPGRYDVRVWVHAVDAESEAPARPPSGMFIGSFQVDVTAKGNTPRSVSSDLYAMMIGAAASRPVTADSWASGAYQVAVALINGSNHAIPGAPASVTLLVFRDGDSVPCSGGEQHLNVPDTLLPGAIELMRVPVTCSPTKTGHYEVVARLKYRDAGQVEIGRFGLLVSRDVDFSFAPEWPGFVPEWPQSFPSLPQLRAE